MRLFLLLLLLAPLLVWWGGLSAPTALVVPHGAPSARVLRNLPGPLPWRAPALQALQRGLWRVRWQAGREWLPLFRSPPLVARSLALPPTQVAVTIPECLTAEQIAGLLKAAGLTTEEAFLQAVRTKELSFLERPASGWEGYLFPETYELHHGYRAQDLVALFVRRFWEWIQAFRNQGEWARRPLHEIVIVASLVNAETRWPDEFPLVASVIYNRLRRGMRLEIDATVAFGLGKIGQPLTYEDLRTDHPYNTYLYPGLPPGPICNPGREALRAALFPARTRYLFFVRRADGRHAFSETLRQHRRNVARWKQERPAGWSVK